jgi:hypothetical protein
MLRQKAFSLNWKQCSGTLLGALLLLTPQPAAAYIGPGAGFALGGSFIFALLGVLLALSALFMWPIRLLIRSLRSRGRLKKALCKRVVVLGLDGLDYGLARQWIDAGQLPNLARVEKLGGFLPLQTTLPAVSPVAWSGFATGADASRHNIFDFLTRDPRRVSSSVAGSSPGPSKPSNRPARARPSGASWPNAACAAQCCACPSPSHLRNSAA